MRSLTDDDLVYCIIKVLVAPTDVSKVLQNDQYIVSTEQGPSHKRGGPRPWNTRSVTPELDYTTLAMTIDPDSMKHPSRGHLFGSDSSDCDVLLDTTNANGISGVHFQLDLVFGEEQPQMLWIVNMSAEATLEIEQAQLSYGQQRALKPRFTNRVQAGLVVFDIVSADRRFEPAVLSKLGAARRKDPEALGLRRLKKLRRDTPRFSHKLTDWSTLQDIPWQNGGVYKLFNTVLGVGRYSTVRKARSRVTDYKTVAVKIIGDGAIANERRSNRELQENELRIMLELEHVNIVRLVDFAVYDAAPFATLLALELATHGTLRNVFLTRVDEDMCRTVTGQVLAGLKYLHKQNTIQRDINPENILVFDNDPTAFYSKLSDFTHARKVTLDDLPGGVQGTPSFMSLECAEDEPCDQRADIFACGKVAFWLLKGEEDLPTDNLSVHVGSALDRVAAHLKTWDREASLRSLGASQLCINLLRSMLTNVLSQRLSAVKCLQHKWFAASTLSSPGVERGCTAVVNQTSHQFPVYIDEIKHEPSLRTLPVELDQLVNSPGSNDADYSSNGSTVADTGVILEGETSNVADSPVGIVHHAGPWTATGSWTATTTQSRLGLSIPDRLRHMLSDQDAEHPTSDPAADSEHGSLSNDAEAIYDGSGLVITADGLHLGDQLDFWSKSQSPWSAGDHPDFSKHVSVPEHMSDLPCTRAPSKEPYNSPGEQYLQTITEELPWHI